MPSAVAASAAQRPRPHRHASRSGSRSLRSCRRHLSLSQAGIATLRYAAIRGHTSRSAYATHASRIANSTLHCVCCLLCAWPQAGSDLDAKHEGGWWPVTLKSRVAGNPRLGEPYVTQGLKPTLGIDSNPSRGPTNRSLAAR